MRAITRKVYPWAIVAALVAVAIVVLFRFDPERSWFYPRCMFHTLTGLQCPGCGSLRSLHALFHGHLRRAFALNPLLFVGGTLAAILILVAKLKPNSSINLSNPVILWSALIVVVLFWILRNLPLFSGALEKWQ